MAFRFSPARGPHARAPAADPRQGGQQARQPDGHCGDPEDGANPRARARPAARGVAPQGGHRRPAHEAAEDIRGDDVDRQRRRPEGRPRAAGDDQPVSSESSRHSKHCLLSLQLT